MRKRTIVSIIITILAIILTNKYWLIFRPMPVDFDIKGKGHCGIEVLFNKKDNNEFKKIKSQYTDVNLNEVNHINFNIKRAKFPKRIKIIISGLESNSPVEISNITLRNGKYNLDDSDSFFAKSGKITIKNRTMIIYPENNIINIEYKKTLNVKSSIKFDFKLFVIILILTFLLSYKLSDYVADFKSVKEKSRIEILFLTIFFIFLFIPMSNINQGDISKNENRTLAKWQPFITQDGEINYNFGKDFNEWFNDRFNLREFFVSKHDMIIGNFMSIVSTNKAFYNKQTNWMFEKVIYDPNLSNENFQKLIADNLNKLNNFCSCNGIKLYLMVIPLQDEIYYENAAPYITPTGTMNTIRNVRNILDYTNFSTIFPYQELRNHSRVIPTYYKTDWHWTDEGAFIGYQSLMNTIKKDFNNIDILSKKDFNITKSNKVRSDWDRKFHNGEVFIFHFHSFENIANNILDTQYNYYDHNNNQHLFVDIIDKPYMKEKIYHYANANNLKLLQLGTSMNESLLQFTPYSFKDVKYIRLINIKDKPPEENFKLIKYYKDEILEFKPDIMVLCITTRNLPALIDLFNME